MNRNFKVVWNRSLGCFTAVAEYAKSRGKSSNGAVSSGASPSTGAIAGGARLVKLSALCVGMVATGFSMQAAAGLEAGGGSTFANCTRDATGNGNEVASIAFSNATGNNIACASGAEAIAIGTNIAATGSQATAIGSDIIASGDLSVVIGQNFNSNPITSTGVGGVAIGSGLTTTRNSPIANGVGSVAIGSSGNATTNGLNGAIASGNHALALISGAEASGVNSVAIGAGSKASAASAYALGENANAVGQNTVALGADTSSNTQYGVSIGRAASSTGQSSVAIGGGTAGGGAAQTSGQGAIAIGSGGSNADGAKATNIRAIAIGQGAIADQNSSVSVGATANASIANSVALGAGSTTTAPAGASFLTNVAAVPANGVVSVGTAAATRRIQNVAGGSAATDAVNVAQLTERSRLTNQQGADTATALGGGAIYTPADGKISTPTYSVVSNPANAASNVNGVGSAINALNSAVQTPLTFTGDNTGTTVTRKLGQTLNVKGGATAANLTENNIGVIASTTDNSLAVKLNKNLDLTATGSVKTGNSLLNNAGLTITGGPSVTAAGINAAGNKITGVTAGTASTDAANVAQVTGARTIVAAGNNVASVVKTTSVATGQDTYTVNANGAKTTAGSNAVTVTESALANNVTQSAVDLSADSKASLVRADNSVQYDQAGKTSVTLGGTGSTVPVTLTNVANGTIAANSKDAINGGQVNTLVNTVTGQLNATNANVTDNTNRSQGNTTALGGGAAYDAANNTYTAPTYSVFTNPSETGAIGTGNGTGTTVRTVGEAIGAINTAVQTPLTFTGNTGTTAQKLGSTLNIAGGATAASSNANVKTVVTGGNIDIQLVDAPTFTGQVKANGFDASTQKIVNVANGTDDTDAVNVGQLNTAANTATNTAPVVYTQADGTQVYRQANGDFNTAADGTGTAVTPANIITSIRSADGSTTTATKLSNVAVGTIGANSTDAVNGSQLNTTNTRVANNTTALGGSYNAAGDYTPPQYDIVTDPSSTTTTPFNTVKGAVEQLSGAIQTPLTFAGDRGNNVSRKLGETLNVKGGAAATAVLTDDNIGVVANDIDNSLTVKLAENINLGATGSLTTGVTTVDNTGVAITGGTNGTVALTNTGLNNGNNQITGVASGLGTTPLATATGATLTNATNVGDLKSAVTGLTDTGFKIKGGSSAADTVALGETVNFTSADTNLVATNGDNVVTYTLAKTLDLGAGGSLTTGATTVDNTGVAITGGTNGTVALTNTGLNNGNNKITGVANGTIAANSKDAINGGQVNTLVNTVTGQLNATNANVTDNTNRSQGNTTALGGGAAYDAANNTYTAPIYSVFTNPSETGAIGTGNGTGTTVRTVGEAIGAINTAVQTPLTFTGNTGTTDRKLGQALAITGSGNLSTVSSAGGIAISLSDTPTFSKVTVTGAPTTATDVTNKSYVDGTRTQVTSSNNTVGITSTTDATTNATTYNLAVDAQALSESAQLPVVYTNAAGAKLYKQADGSFNTAVDGTGTTVASANIVASVQNADGSTTTATTLTNVKAGAINAGSTDAVNGSQLNTTNNAVTGNTINITDNTNRSSGNLAALGGGAAYDATTNTYTAPSYVLDDGTNNGTNAPAFRNVGDALGNLDTRTTSNTTNINDINAGLSGIVRQDAGTGAITVGAQTGGASVNFAGTNGVRTLSGLANGTVAAGSTEAVTGDQLNSSAASLATIIGGNAVNNGGVVTTTDIGGTGANTIDGAISSLNTAATQAKSTVTQGDNIVVNTSTNKDGSTNYQVTTAKNITVDSVTTGNTVTNTSGVTINDGSGNITALTSSGTKVTDSVNTSNYNANGFSTTDGTNSTTLNQTGLSFANGNVATGPSITAQGVNANGTTISNLANGVLAGDAVNKAQLDSVVAQNLTDVEVTDQDGNDETINVTDQVVNKNINNENEESLFLTYNKEGQEVTDRLTIGQTVQKMNTEGVKFAHTNASPQSKGDIADGVTNDSSAGGENSTAIGVNAIATQEAKESVVIGVNSVVSGVSSVAIGNGSKANGNQSIAIGTGNVVNGNNSGAFGDPNIVNSDNSYAVGNDNTINSDDTFVLGNNVTETVEGSVVLGTGSGATTGAGIAGYGAANNAAIAATTSTTGAIAVGNANADAPIYRQITGVAAGTADSDAVNVSQLRAVDNRLVNNMNDLGYKINEVEDDANAGISAAMAMSSIPQSFIPGKSMVGGGISSYNGESAVAVGVSRVSDNGRWVIKANGTADTQGNAGGAIGAGFHF